MGWKLGAYRVDDAPLAAGATAQVFAARRGRAGERVAIKVLPLKTFRERAEAEANIATIEHPRLITIHERVVDEKRGVVGLVMDLASEGDLRTLLRSGALPSALEVLQIADDVLAALEALHAGGLVHRDVKPENVLLEKRDGLLRARLGDLGIARAVDRTRTTGSVLGTDLYIAPEVHDGAAVSAAADLWALGYVMYEGLFGAPPHADASTAYQRIGRLRVDGPDRPPEVPDAIWNVVAALLAPNPLDRPASATDARRLLRSARDAAQAVSEGDLVNAAGRPTGRRRSSQRSLEPRVAPAYEREPAATRGIAAAAAVAIAVAALTWVGGKSGFSPFTSPTEPIAATRQLTPMAPESVAVVPTRYTWQLRNGSLAGRLHVSNPSAATTEATAIPELFPSSAARNGSLALIGYEGTPERQRDGSILVRFAVPPLAPRAHHVVAFRVTLPTKLDDSTLLRRLVRDRTSAITRLDFTLSGAPTLESIELALAPSVIVVGGRATASVTGRASDNKPADGELLRDIRFEVLGGHNIARVDDGAIVGIAPGNVIVRAVVGDLTAEAPLTITAPPPVKQPATTSKPAPRPVTTRPPETTIIEEEAPPPPPKDYVV